MKMEFQDINSTQSYTNSTLVHTFLYYCIPVCRHIPKVNLKVKINGGNSLPFSANVSSSPQKTSSFTSVNHRVIYDQLEVSRD